MKIFLLRLKDAISYLCGYDDAPPPGLPLPVGSPWWRMTLFRMTGV